MMKKKYVMLAAAVAAMVAGQAMAQESPWLVRFRAVQLGMANERSADLEAALHGVGSNDKVIGEVDVSYFFTPNIAAELILTVPQQQIVRANSGQLGTFVHLPPTLNLQYHFTGLQGFKPYVGAGVNYTKISSVDIAGGAGDLKSSSTGASLQAGLDIPLDKKWSINMDVKKVYIKSDVFVGGVNKGTLKLDPTLFGVGLGYRF